MRGTYAGLIHIEYAPCPNWSAGLHEGLGVRCPRTLPSGLRILDVSEHVSRYRHRFENGYKSEELARILDFVMQHQNSFLAPANLGRQGLLQIPTPTEKESAAAAISISEAIHDLESQLTQPAGA